MWSTDSSTSRIISVRKLGDPYLRRDPLPTLSRHFRAPVPLAEQKQIDVSGYLHTHRTELVGHNLVIRAYDQLTTKAFGPKTSN